MKLTAYVITALQINALIDSGEKLNIESAKKAINEKEIFNILDIDMTFLEEREKEILLNELKQQENADIDHTLGINSKGLCLILSYLLNLLKR